MERHREMWLAVEKEHGVLTQREAYVALTAMEWADKTMIKKVEEWLKINNRAQLIGSLNRFLKEE